MENSEAVRCEIDIIKAEISGRRKKKARLDVDVSHYRKLYNGALEANFLN